MRVTAGDGRGLVAAVGPFARCVALDMPGFGQADKPRDFPQTAVGHAEHLEGALTQPGIERVHLVLHDFGGLWGLAWAVGHALRQFGFPALVIWGARDHFLPVKHARQQFAAFPSARLVILDDAGHWPLITHAAETEAAVVDFLREVTSTEAEAPGSDRVKGNILRSRRIRARQSPA